MLPVIPKSRTPKSLPKPASSKFKRMKRRLQLKARVNVPEEPVNTEFEDDIEDGQPLATEVPPPQAHESEAPQQDDQATHEEQVGQGPCKTGKKNKSGLFNRSSPMKIFRVCKKMNKDQREVIINADFGDTLRMKCSKLIPELCRFLMGCFNPDTCELDFGDRGRIPLNLQSVVSVLGVPMGSNPVVYKMKPEATKFMLDMFGIKDAKQPLIASLEKELGPSHPADEVFLRKYMIYLVCSVFAPTTGIAVSPRCYPFLVNIEDIRELNWPKFIIDTFIRTAREKDKKNWFKACMPYLMVRYVDSLETKEVYVPQDGTRVSVWTNKLVRLVVELDTNSDGSFGKLPLKKCFRIKLTLFSAEPSTVDMFIKTHVPGEHTEEFFMERELAKYRGALTEMCTVFEDGLAQFLKNLSSSHSNGPQLEEEEHQVRQQSNKSKRRNIRRTRQATLQFVNEANHVEEEMDMNTMRDEATVSPIVQKESKKRKANDEGLQTGRRAAKTHHQATAEENGNSMQQQKEALPLATEDTFELDMEIAVCNVSAKLDNLDLFSNRGGITDEHTVGIAEVGVDPLKIVQSYGTGSQSSADSIGGHTIPKKPSGESNKEATFSDQPSISVEKTENAEACIGNVEQKNKQSTAKCIMVETAQAIATPRRPITRSMSPLNPASTRSKDITSPKKDVSTSGIVAPSPKRATRFATAGTPKKAGTPHEQTPRSLLNNIMSRKLELEFGSKDSLTETEEQRRRQELIDDCPSFDLGIDSSPAEAGPSKQEPADHEEELVVISSNEDSGDSLDKIYASIEMPIRETASNKVQESTASPCAPNSYTPVPQAHQKRVVKPVAAQKSPFVQYENRPVASKTASELYSKICSYGRNSEDKINTEKIIDYGNWYLYLGDLANSIRPTGWLSNSVCEFALHVLSKEMNQQKKHLMPLNIGTKLRSPHCIHDQGVQKAFEFSSTNRLDHKEQIMFSVLQDLSPKTKTFTGHYYLIVLNLKTERFEVMDSLRPEGTPSLMSDSAAIIGAIKYLWSTYYEKSSIDISKYKRKFIDTPMQKTTCDCGYFMLKFIEAWDGRRMLPFSQSDIPIMRKLLLKKWIDCAENMILWKQLLFKN